MMQFATSPTVDTLEEFYVTGGRGAAKTTANRATYYAHSESAGNVHPYLDYLQPPKIMPNVSFGGYDDPFVVSDDDVEREELESRHSRQNAIHSFLSKSMSARLYTEGVVVGRNRESGIADGYSSKFTKFSNLLSAVTTGALSSGYVSALVSTVLLDVSRTSALFDRTSYTALQTASLRHRMMNSYSALLTPLFAEAGYSGSEPYEDGLGALVIDYIRSEERVTFALDDNEAELLYFEDGQFQSAIYESPAASLLEVVNFVKNKFM